MANTKKKVLLGSSTCALRYGKTYSEYKLYQGDFLDPEHYSAITSSNIVFVNNYAFGPEVWTCSAFCLVLFFQVDEKLKEIFKDLEDGTWIFSSKLLCSPNFRVSPRKVS